MIETAPAPARSSVRGAIIGIILGLAAHAVVFGVAYLVGQAVEPSGGEMIFREDVWAFIVTVMLGEAVAALACLTAGIVLIVRRNRAMGLGLILAWLLFATPIAALTFGV